MTALADLQARFQQFLLAGNGDIEPLTVGTGELPAGDRLAVYADAYRLRLLEALAEDFPGLKSMIGDEAFHDLGAAYLDACPSTDPSIRWFGRRLPDFLRTSPVYRRQSILVEMAGFEWAQGEVLDAGDSPAVGIDDLGAVDPREWPVMRIVFQRALRRLDLHWNVPVIWQAIREGDSPPPPARSETPTAWLLWRRDLDVYWRSLDIDECLAIELARGGADFATVCEQLLARSGDDQVPLRAAAFLKRWAGDELLAELAL